MGTMSDFARRMVGSDSMDEEQLRQIREQQEVILYPLCMATNPAPSSHKINTVL